MSRRTCWQDRHPDTTTAPDAPDGAETADTPVDGDWDVIVVGAGLTGLTTAVQLGRAGRSVLVVEARTIGRSTTGASTAKLSLLQGTQLSRIATRQPVERLNDYVGANRAAQAWTADFCRETGVAVQRVPAYTYATTEQGEAAARRELRHVERTGLPARWVDDVPLPLATRGAIRLDDQVQLDPVELLGALADDARAHGVRIAENARVVTVRGRRPVQVRTERGTARAAAVVVATNMPILDRGAWFARLVPARSYLLSFETTGSDAAVDGMFLSTDSTSRSLRRAPGAAAGDASAAGAGSGPLLLVGGNGHTTGRASSPEAKLDDLRSWTREHFDVGDETHAWSAQDYVPHHGLPFAGPAFPGRPEVLMAGGYAKWGMTNGVAAALLLSSQLLGEPAPPWSEAFRAWSSHEVRGLPTAGRANAEVGLAMAAGWVRPLLRPGAGAAPAEGEGRVEVDHVGTPTAVSTTDGTTRRVSAVCTHLGGIVTWNDAERSWDCPLHGSRFDADGSVLEGVATCGLRPRGDA